jgi:hypothetical protein
MIAIMQPTFLPWIGYFDLIDQVDDFVFLNDVQFSKQSWQQRNRIATPRGLEWVTIPVESGPLGRMINEVKISSGVNSAASKIENNYKKYPYFSRYWPEIKLILLSFSRGDDLSSLNIDLIKSISLMLGINVRFTLSSSLECSTDKIQRLIDINNQLNSIKYLSPIGSKDYLSNHIKTFNEKYIEVKFHDYNHPNYQINGLPFYLGASVIDLLFSCGDKAIQIIRSGREDPFLHQGGKI